MSGSNQSNRPHVTTAIGAVAATKEVGLVHAHKKMEIKGVKLTDIVIIGVDAVNFVTSKLQINGVDVAGSEVTTEAGHAAREGSDIPMPAAGLYLEKGELLGLVMTVDGTGAYSNLSAHTDCEIIGN